jgi:hypothetical protein
MRIKNTMDKTYGGIIQLHKSDAIFSQRMRSMLIRDGKGTKHQETLMGKPNSSRYRWKPI